MVNFTNQAQEISLDDCDHAEMADTRAAVFLFVVAINVRRAKKHQKHIPFVSTNELQ